MPLNEIVYKIESIFQTPVEKRHPRYSHLKMKDGTIFNSQVSILADDGAKITVKKLKSSRYADFSYYAISAEKDGVKSTINIDPDKGRIIYSDENDKPIIIGGVVQHIRRNEAIYNTHCPESWDKYFYQLFNNETNDGKIENSDLHKKPMKKYRPEENFEKELMLTSLYSFDL